MLSVEKRISLRDRLINIIYQYCEIIHKRNLTRILKNISMLQPIYNLYISEFRSEDEALYCLRYKDDYTNHICPICGNISEFYINIKYSRYHYIKTCGSNECYDKLIHNEDTRKKAEETCLILYGNKNIFALPEFRAKADRTKEKRYGDKNYNNRSKCRQTKLERYGDPNYNNLEKLVQTFREKYNVDWYFQTEEFKEKSKATNQSKRGCDWAMQDPVVKALAKASYLAILGVEYPSQSEIVKEKIRKTYIKNHCCDKIDTEKIEYILSQLEMNIFESENNSHIEHYDLYSNNIYLTMLIEFLYKEKRTYLRLKDLSSIFNVTNETIYKRIKQVNMESYFYVLDSLLELQFKDFLINIKVNNINFKRRDHSILPINLETGRHLELDFYLSNYNIAFEINDVDGHNIKEKEISYHYTKTKQCLDKNVRLIHLWEWELTNNILWNKVSNWITNNLLNQSKTQLDLETDCNYDIRLIGKDEAIEFLNNYSLDNERRFNKFIGIYHNNELIELLSFINDKILSICVKFGYKLINGTNEVLESYIQLSNTPYILTYTDLSKFTGNSLEEIGFKLIQYQNPNIISEMNTTSKYKQLYNCGYNVYILTK